MNANVLSRLMLLAVVAAAAPAALAQPTSMPVGNRFYQVLAAPEAKAAEGLPLIVYIPSSSSPQIEAFTKDYWPMLRDRKCVVAIPTAKSERMWETVEANYIAQVIVDVQKQYKIDPRKVIPLGISGGAQVAMFLADHGPEAFRAMILVSASPVVIRGEEAVWFYPSRKVYKTCPYFVYNSMTGSTYQEYQRIQYWRQLQEKVNPQGASITFVPIPGENKGHYLPPPKELAPWLDEVLAGKQPTPLPDAQKAAVAKMFEKVVAALPEAMEKASKAPGGTKVSKDIETQALAIEMPADCERSKADELVDAAGRPMRQIRIEHKKDPIYIRAEARQAGSGMKQVLAADEAQTIERGMLYQIYTTGKISAGGRNWEYRIGSITFPHAKKGWQSTLFINAWSPMTDDAKQWLELTLLDETQAPDAAQMAGLFKSVLASVEITAASPKAATQKTTP